MTESAIPWADLAIALSIGLLAIGLVVGLAFGIGRRNRTVADIPALWDGRDYHCPQCGAPMDQGWTLLGKGAIWTDRISGRLGTFAHIGKVLPNTLSMQLKPAANMAWRCIACRILTIDYDKMVR
ncbi:MAG: PF20097 family protein [Thiohalocapsa sp.]